LRVRKLKSEMSEQNLSTFSKVTHSIDTAAFSVQSALPIVLPKSVSSEAQEVLEASVIMGSLALKQAYLRQQAVEPIATANIKTLCKVITSDLISRFTRGKQDTNMTPDILRAFGKVVCIREVQYWMIPFLLVNCGVKQVRAEELQPQILRMLQEVADLIDTLPFPANVGPRKPRESGKDGQEMLTF